jgi:hypothetical protein
LCRHSVLFERVTALSALVECRLSLVCCTHLRFQVSRDRIANGKQVKNWPSSAEGSVAHLSRVVFSFWMVALRTGFWCLMQKSNLWRARNNKNLFDLDHIWRTEYLPQVFVPKPPQTDRSLAPFEYPANSM